MESYGEVLKRARLAKQTDIETITQETTITRKYLEALEVEDEGAFPGEPYLIGFLRTYADYVGVDPDFVSNLYRAKKIQESPVPEGLIAKRKPASFWVMVILFPLLGLAAIGAAVWFFALRPKEIPEDERNLISHTNKNHMYELTTDKPLVRRLYKGDQITVPAVNGNVILTISNTLKHLTLESPSGSQIVELSEEVEMDIDGDNKVDLIVYVSDVSTTEERGAETRLLASDGGSILPSVAAESIPSAASLPSARTVVFSDSRAYPFTINASFRGPCLFRYRLDRKEKIQEFFNNSDALSLTASNGIRLWMSNFSAVKLQVIANLKTYDLDIGTAGQVKVEDIRWVRDTDGRYLLVVTDVD